MRYIYLISGFDLVLWQESTLMAFETEAEARHFCELHTRPLDIIYTYDCLAIGTYPKVRAKEGQLS